MCIRDSPYSARAVPRPAAEDADAACGASAREATDAKPQPALAAQISSEQQRRASAARVGDA
eukprot:1511393-Alexandrium_andersonii.AAC.1